MRSACLILMLMNCTLTMLAQDAIDLPHAYPEIESLVENQSEEIPDKSATLDELDLHRQRPVNINAATFQELTEVPFLPQLLALRIVFMRDSLGTLTLAELRMISEFDEATWRLISPFVFFGRVDRTDETSADIFGETRVSLRSRWSSDIQLQQPFREGKYAGSPLREYYRLQASKPHMSAGLIVEKDAGERMSDGFLSWYISMEDIGVLNKVVLGNYTLNVGEGLTLSSYRSSSKGGNALTQTKATGKMIVPHLSTDEFHRFQGAAASLELYPVLVTLFLSRKKIDGTVDSSGTLTSFYSAGLYRTPSELGKRNTAGENVFGGNITLLLGRTHKIGLTVIQAQYDKELAVQSPNVISSKSISAAGVNASIVFDSFDLFGEVAGNSFSSRSADGGMVYRVSKKFSVSSHLRAYGDGYVNPFAYGFGERSGIVNGEKGRYLGFSFQPTRKITISSYYDEFSLPSMGEFGVTGTERVIRYEHLLSSKVNVLAQYRKKSKSETNQLENLDGSSLKILEERIQESIRLACTFTIDKRTSIAQRLEFTEVSYSVSGGRERGILMFTEISTSTPANRVECVARVIFYDTPSYGTRMYAFESDVPGGYSFPPLYGSGMRWYILGSFKPFSHVGISIKYSEAVKFNAVPAVSESGEEMMPLDNRVTFQVDVVL